MLNACYLTDRNGNTHALSLFGSVGKTENWSLSEPYGQAEADLRAALQGQNSDA